MAAETSAWSGEGVRARLLIAYARHVPAHPSKIRIFRWLARLAFPHGLRVITRAGVRMRVDPRDYIGHEICFSRAYEPQSLALAQRLLAAGGTFLDVGANFGLYTCPIATLPGVFAIAVDASARAFTKLQDNLALNPGARVVAVNAALGASRSLLRLETPVADNLGTTRVAAGDAAGAPCSMVAAITLDELLGELRVERLTLMKIDVEGYESIVLQGLDLAASYRPDHILMEYSDRIVAESANLQACFELLTRAGYQPYSVTGEPFAGVLPLPEENLWWRHGALI